MEVWRVMRISVTLTQTVEYGGEFTRDEVVDLLAEYGSRTNEDDYASMPDIELFEEFRRELFRLGDVSLAVYCEIEKWNKVLNQDWNTESTK